MAYFNNAATTYPKPDEVYSYMEEFNRTADFSEGRANSNGKLVSETRSVLKTLFHCENKEVIFTPSDTIAMNIIIQGMLKDETLHNIYISPFEHNAVTRILKAYEDKINVIVIPVNKQMVYEINSLNTLFAEKHPDIVIVSHASNVCGLVAPIKEIFESAKRYKAKTVLDMAQTAGLIDVDLSTQNIDYAVFAGHKTLYGPTGISGFVCSPNTKLQPILFGGTGIDSLNQKMPEALPERFEMGTLNIFGIAGLNASAKWILNIGIKEIFDVEQRNRMRLIDILRKYDNIKIVGNCETAESVGVVSVLFDGYSSDSIGEVFKQHNVVVRTGLHCAPQAHTFLGTCPAGTVRFSVSYFTTEKDFKELIEVLDFIEENG